MKTRTVIIILALMVTAVSCIPSLYPLYREKDLITDENLEGFYPNGEDDFWMFSKLDIEGDLKGDWKNYKSGSTYKLTQREDGEQEDFAVHLLKLGEYYYLDFFPVNPDIQPDFLEMHLAPAHIFARTEIADNYLIIQFFDPEWLTDLIEDNKIKISYVELKDRYLLTAKTEELQKFITKFANDSTTFLDADTLYRQPIISMN